MAEYEIVVNHACVLTSESGLKENFIMENFGHAHPFESC